MGRQTGLRIRLSWSGGKSRNGKVGSSVSFEQAVRNLLCLEEMVTCRDVSKSQKEEKWYFQINIYML